MENDLKMSEKWTKNANYERPYYIHKHKIEEHNNKSIIMKELQD